MNIFCLLLRKTAKSTQLKLNEFFHSFLPEVKNIPTNSAFTQARAKFKHGAFIELLHVVNEKYYQENVKLFKNLRLLAVDGSKIHLPENEILKEKFGTQKYGNKNQKKSESVMALTSVMYDVLNEIALDALIEPYNSNERKLAEIHLEKCCSNDCLIFDRGYVSQELIKIIMKRELFFLMRCPRNQFKEIIGIHELIGDVDKIINLEGLQIRVIKFNLENGEPEILLTNLLDSKQFSIEDFKKIYNYRWKEEGYFKILKERLNLENWSGLTIESIYQDFYATIFLTNFESIFVENANEELEQKGQKKNNKYKQKVNKNISFHTIKTKIYDLLFTEPNKSVDLIEEIENLFIQTPVLVRQNRKNPRNKSIAKSLRHRKGRYKFCF